MALTMQEIIKKKRDKTELLEEEIYFFIKSVVNGSAHDAQIGALLMAIFLNGMSNNEVTYITKAMMETGECLKWEASWENLLADKHSTGGVGDKISLVLAPALAACGLKIPVISGRSLGFTGGTLDKLESIPDFQVILTVPEMSKCLENVGCFIAGQTDSIATGDKILYRMRDLTNTIACIPLIISSILSKKAAEGTNTLLMDIKVGRGAFMKTEETALNLAKRMMEVSRNLNIEMNAVLSDMNVPIGRCVGNALEVIESIDCLKNDGSEDVLNLVKTLGGMLLKSKDFVKTKEEGERRIEEVIRNQSALTKFKEMLIYQGVSETTAAELCSGNYTKLPKSKYVTNFSAEMSGVVWDINAMDIALACWHLGAGRSERSELIDYSAGIKLLKLIGEKIEKDEDWIEVHHNEHIMDTQVEKLIRTSLIIGPSELEKKPFRIIQIL